MLGALIILLTIVFIVFAMIMIRTLYSRRSVSDERPDKAEREGPRKKAG